MKKPNRDRVLSTILAWGIGAILLIAPFYAPMTVLLAGHLHHFDLLRIWKEIALTGLGLTILFFLITHKRQTMVILREKLLLLILAYGLLLCGIAAYDLITAKVSTPAVIYGLMINLRLVVFFVVVYLSFRIKELNHRFAWWKFVLVPSMIVIGFGLLQMTVLPKDFLKHIGYNKQTIVPYQTVDNRTDFVRIQSTLRGPNPLGAYMVLIITLVATLILSQRYTRRRKLMILLLFGGFVVLYGSYSRSAVLGTAVSLVVLLAVQQYYRPHWLRKSYVLPILGVFVVVGTSLFILFRHSYVVETTILHSSDKSTSVESSNSQRGRALRSAVNDVFKHPLGGGIGSAGPASLRNTKNPNKIAENYFLQVGQEAGWLGMAFVIIIMFAMGARLYKLRFTALACALFASLIGLTLVNLLSHAWADDTLAYIWWGLAGIALAHRTDTSAILTDKQ